MTDTTSGSSGPPEPTPSEPAPAPDHAARPSSGRTLLLGIGVTLLVLVAAGVVAVAGLTAEDSGGPASPADAVVVDDGARGTIADRVAPDHEAPLPEMELSGFADGDPVATTAYRGTPLVLNFWGSWCGPCVEEMPELQALADAGQGRVAVLGVNYDDRRDAAEELVSSLGITFDLAVDDGGELFRAVEGFGMPTTLFVDAGGQIRYRHTGPLDAELLGVLVREHLGVEVTLPR